jgi:ABC-2 type transport system ATP-binding protein
MTIQINALRKTYGSFECSVDELFIESGQTIKLYGNNGAGKTTLLRLLLNLIPADGGDILVDGMSVVNDFDWRKKTAAYLDEGFQIPFLTVDEYLRFLLDVYGCPVPTELNLHQTYGGLIDQDFDPSVRVGKLSAGNRVKAGLLGVFMVTPSLLVLDEPFAHLDPRSKAGLISLIDSYRHDHPDATIILSSHDISITNRIVGRNLVMRKGQIIYDGMDHETSASEIESLLM